MILKSRIGPILKKDYPNEKAWKAFIYWWLAANGYDYEINKDRVIFTDGAKDGGIDAIAWPLESLSGREVLVVQSKYFGQAPTCEELERFEHAKNAIAGTIDNFNDWLETCRDELHPHYRRLREERRGCRYIVIAPCPFTAWARNRWLSRGIEVHDNERLSHLETNYSEGRTPRLDEIKIRIATKPQVIAEAAGTRVWVFTVLVRELGRLFERYNNTLFAGNIRYALRGQTANRVRSGMLETLQDYPHEFVFSHNGITITGDGLKRQGDSVVMSSSTIVNGAQTVSYLGRPKVMKHLTKSTSRVIVKYVEVNDAEMLNDIESKVAFRSNNQNKVELSDLMIELPSLVSLQRFFRRQGVHLERKKGEQKVQYGELGIPKERLAQILAAVGSPQGAVKGKSKQKLFKDVAHGLFGDYDKSEKARAEAVAWARVDTIFRATINDFANKKRRKRAQIAQLASLTVFGRVLRSAGLNEGFLRAMSRWKTDQEVIECFLDKSFKVIITALLKCSSVDKKNEPAFYKAEDSVKPAVETAAKRSQRKIKTYYQEILGS